MPKYGTNLRIDSCTFDANKIYDLKVASDGGDGSVTSMVDSADVDVVVEANKAATINAATYVLPVEVVPSSGKDAMAKVTVTVSNIPSPSLIGYKWSFTVGGKTGYKVLPFNVAPETLVSGDANDMSLNGARVGASNPYTVRKATIIPVDDAYVTYTDIVYTKISDTSFSLSYTETADGESTEYSFVYAYVNRLWDD